MLQRVAELSTAAFAGADFAGIAMLGADGRPTTGIYTDEDSPSVDRAQYESGRGPCLDAWQVKRVVRIDDMRQATDVHPEFARAALDHGTPSTLSLPLIAGSKGLGV